MKGLRLYVRPIETADHDAVRAFLATHGAAGFSPPREAGGLKAAAPPLPSSAADAAAAPPVPACGLLGKLLGDIVAVVALEITGDAVRVIDLFVAEGLRRKRIGRVMMREVEQLAAKFERRRIIVDDARGAQEFFRRIGFENEGDRWVRHVA